MGIRSLGRRMHKGRLFRALAVFMLALILWLLVMLTLISADASLLVDLSSRLKANYGFDLLGGGMGPLKLSIIGEALRDNGDGSGGTLLNNLVPTATKSGGGTQSSPTPTNGLERSNTNTPGSPTATVSPSTPSPTPTIIGGSSERTPSSTPGGTAGGGTNETITPTPSNTPTDDNPTEWPNITPTVIYTYTPTPTYTYTPQPTYTYTQTQTYTNTPNPSSSAPTPLPIWIPQ